MKIDYVPANTPGCQMMSNINYVPASAPETGRWKATFTPASIGAIHNGYNICNYVPASSGIDAPFINSKLAKINYVPCSSSVTPGPSGVTESTVYKLSWWEDTSFFKYPYMLITAFYGMKWKDNFREYFNIPDDFIIIGDSGGFQNMTQHANLNPIDVLRWQEKHCQIGLTFDLPIMENDTQIIKKQKQLQTAINASIAFKERKNQNLKLYAVFQGHTIEEQKRMIEYYSNNIALNNFDGIAIGGLVPISGNTEKLIIILTTFCYNIKDYNKPVHFFGLSGNKIIPYIKYLANVFNLSITFDSSSYGAGAIRREFWVGNGEQKINIMTDTKDDDIIPCKCPVCSKVQYMKTYRADGSLAGGLISLHNLYQTIQHVQKEIDYILEPKYKKFIDIMKTNGPDLAFQILNPLKNKQSVQHGIFKLL